jgi:hypothetical protein
MPVFLKDAAALISIVAFAATVGLWADLVRALV